MGEESVYEVVAEDEKAFGRDWGLPTLSWKKCGLKPLVSPSGGHLQACGGLQGRLPGRGSCIWCYLLLIRLDILGRERGSWEAVLRHDKMKGEWLARGGHGVKSHCKTSKNAGKQCSGCPLSDSLLRTPPKRLVFSRCQATGSSLGGGASCRKYVCVGWRDALIAELLS